MAAPAIEMTMVRTFKDTQMIGEVAQLFSANYGAVILANIDTVFTVPNIIPAGAGGSRQPPYYIQMRQDFSLSTWFALNQVAVAPTAATFSQISGEMLVNFTPTMRRVRAGDEIHFLSTDVNCPISITLWYIPNQ